MTAALESIREKIDQLRNLDDDSAVETEIENIFYDLLYADESVFVFFRNEVPFYEPLSSDEARMYLRFFSHREVCEKTADRYDGVEIRSVSVLEAVQIAKYAFRQGVYGCVLNEGDKWVTISLPSLIKTFYARSLKDISFNQLYDPTFVAVIQFIGEMKRNRIFRYSAVCPDFSEDEWDGSISQADAELSNEPLRPISAQSLFHVKGDIIRIEGKDRVLTVGKNQMIQGLRYCGIEPSNTGEIFLEDYRDEEISLQKGGWDIQDISELALVFDPVICSPRIQPENSESNGNTSEATLETVMQEGLEPPSEDIQEGPPAAQKGGKGKALSKFGGLKSRLWERNKKEKSNTGIEVLPEQGTSHDLQQEGQEKKQEKEQGEEQEENTDITESEGADVGAEKQQKKGKKKAVFWGILAALLAVCCMTGVFAVQRHTYRQRFEEFCSYVDSREYGNAYALYTEADLGSDANQYLSDALDTLILQYGANTIRAEELSAAMQALSHFPPLSQKLEMAYLMATQLETSKNAYVTGKESSDIYTRLSTWRQVMELDTVNYQAVRKDVAENEQDYIPALYEEITYYSTRIREFARERYEVLAYWYPDNEITAELYGIYAVEPAAPLSRYGVSISDISIRQNPDSYWTLSIQWKNTSVKTIANICFSVVALGETGEIISNKDAEGTWTLFDAVDSHRYETRQGPSTPSYNWYHVFYGPNVCNVKLTAVNITYADGSTSCYTSDVDLANILS